MHLGEQPFFRLYTHFVLIIIGRDLDRIHNIIIIFVGLLYCNAYHWGVHFFVTSRYDFAVKRFFVFLIHTVFVGQSRGNGVINRSEIWPRKPWGEHLAPGPPNIIIYVGIHLYIYILFTSANFYHIIIVIMRKPIDWRRKENRRRYVYIIMVS